MRIGLFVPLVIQMYELNLKVAPNSKLMILLDRCEYGKATEALRAVTINNLFARSVLEKVIKGTVYVDNPEHPETFYISHPYGMSLLFGKTDHADFNARLRDYALNTFKIRDRHEWLQVFPEAWNQTLAELFAGKIVKSKDNTGKDNNNKIEENTRVNFKFNREKYLDFKSGNIPDTFEIVRTNMVMYDNLNGIVVPKYFWRSAKHFYKSGVGFSLIFDNKVASTAYSAFIFDNKLEIGIETMEDSRRSGFAAAVSAALIDYCLENDFEPVWACKLENTASYQLAQKLGFEPTFYIPFYRLII